MEELQAAEAKPEAVAKSGPQINCKIDKVYLNIPNTGNASWKPKKWVKYDQRS
jgi:hypothetical protein